MYVLALVTFAHNNVPKPHVFQCLHDRLVIALFQRIGVETNGTWKQVGVLGQSDKSRADCLARYSMEGLTINADAPGGEVNHTEEAEDEGRLPTADRSVSSLQFIESQIYLPVRPTTATFSPGAIESESLLMTGS